MSKLVVLKSNVVIPEGKKYKVCELSYKTEEGKVKSMKIFGFAEQKAVFDVAASAAKGDVLEATFKQNEKGYWEFGSLANTGEKQGTEDSPKTGSGGARTGNWETPEERAARQVLIVRQSSFGSAVAYAESQKLKVSIDEVIGLAQQIEAYVMGKPAVEVTGEVQ